MTISITQLTEKVYRALDAHLLEKMRDSVARCGKSLSEVFNRHDGNKDGLLERQELENLFLELEVAFKP